MSEYDNAHAAVDAIRVREDAERLSLDQRIAGLQADNGVLAEQLTAALAKVAKPGPGYPGTAVDYDTLSKKSTVQATIESAVGQQATTTKQVLLPSGTFEAVDYKGDPASRDGFLIYHAYGLHGAGPGQTIFQVKANTSTQAAKAPDAGPVGSQNVLSIMDIRSRYVSGFTVRATQQPHRNTNGILYYENSDGLVYDIRAEAIPGAGAFGAGETFSHHINNNKRMTYRNIQQWGKDASGKPVSASAFAVVSSADIRMDEFKSEFTGYGHGFACWESTNLTFFKPYIVDSYYNAMNFENCKGTMNIYSPTLLRSATGAGLSSVEKGVHISIATNKVDSNAIYNIFDANYDGSKLRVRVCGYDGKPATQKTDRIFNWEGRTLRNDKLEFVLS